MIPDVVLLGIFDFYIPKKHFHYYKKQIEAWHTLAHVCRKWRNVVFGSPRRLNLRLCCVARTPVREMLDIWPPFPIIIWDHNPDSRDEDNIAAALEHNDRICQLIINHPRCSEFGNGKSIDSTAEAVP
jgi:F-box-like